MNKIYRYFQKISFFSAIVLIWSVLSTVVLIAMNIQTSLAAISILVFIAVLSLIRPFPLSSWLAMIIGTLIYTMVCYSIYGLSQTMLVTTSMTFLVYLVTTLLANFYIRQTSALEEQIRKGQDLLDDLVQYDQSTGILRWKYAQQKLRAEVLRSVRYKKELSLVLIQLILPKRAEISEKELLNLNGQVVEVMISAIRGEVDVPFIGEKLGLILPETSTEGAQILAARLADNIFRKVRVEIAVGIAGIPDDAVTMETLLDSAEMALKFAMSAGQTVVPASRLREAVERKNVTETPQEDEVPLAAPEFDPLDEPLGSNEWRLNILDFNSMNDLPDLEKLINSIEGVSDFQFINLDKTRLAVKIKSEKADLSSKLKALPQFVLKKVDRKKRVIQMQMKAQE